jgi:ATP-dependent Lon protease
VFFGGALSGRDTWAVQKTVSDLLKLLYASPEPNDADARNLIISTIEAESHPVIKSQLSRARNRAFKDHGQLPRVLKHMVREGVRPEICPERG